MTLTKDQRATLWADALNIQDRNAFVSDWATSSLFLDPNDTNPIPEDLIQTVGQVWDAAHRSISDIRATTGLSQARFAALYGIPKRTYQNWEIGRGCPNYIRYLIQKDLDLL